MSDDRYGWVRVDLIFGYVHLESRLRREGNRLIGEGRARHFDLHNNLTKDTGWKPTGCAAEVWDEYPDQPRRWWQFWK